MRKIKNSPKTGDKRENLSGWFFLGNFCRQKPALALPAICQIQAFICKSRFTATYFYNNCETVLPQQLNVSTTKVQHSTSYKIYNKQLPNYSATFIKCYYHILIPSQLTGITSTATTKANYKLLPLSFYFYDHN